MTSRFSTFAIQPTLLSLLLAAGCTACSNAPVKPPLTFPASAYLTAMTSSTALSVEVRTSPQPPARGMIAVELTITQAVDGTPVDGITLQVRPWMPAHDHGTSIAPTTTAKGQGKYLVTDVDLFMAGHWELQTTFSGPAMDYVAPAFDVQ
jgi:hypothetical protein